MRIYPAITLVAILLSSNVYADFSRDEAAAVCINLGITPESTTVLGLNYSQTQAAFDRLVEHEQTVFQLQHQELQLQLSMSELDSQKRMIRYLESAVDILQAEQDIELLATQVASLTQSIAALQDQIRSTFFGSLDSILIDRVCQPSGLAGLVPAEFRVVDLRAEDYTEIFAALLAEQRALEEDVQLDIDSQLTLSRFRNLPAIQDARSDLLYNLDAVRSAFND